MPIELIPPAARRPYATLLAASPQMSLLDIDPVLFETAYKQHGALLLRGFALDVPRLAAFADSICTASIQNLIQARTRADQRYAIQTVAAGDQAFELHPELSREPWKPDIAMFGCLNPPSLGGETLICDGVALVEALPDPVRRAFEKHRLRYVYRASQANLEFWLGTRTPTDAQLANPGDACPFTFYRNGDAIAREFSRPALHRPMFVESVAWGNFLLFARYTRRQMNRPVLDDGSTVPLEWTDAARLAGERERVAIAWRKGDLLVLDNTRFLHGRNAIMHLAERRVVSYFGFLAWAEPDAEEPPNAPWRRPGFEPPDERVQMTDLPSPVRRSGLH